jgi:hypothetical protein
VSAQNGLEYRGWISPGITLVRWETVRISVEDAYRIRRVYRKLAKLRCHLHRLTVFVRYQHGDIAGVLRLFSGGVTEGTRRRSETRVAVFAVTVEPLNPIP